MRVRQKGAREQRNQNGRANARGKRGAARPWGWGHLGGDLAASNAMEGVLRKSKRPALIRSPQLWNGG